MNAVLENMKTRRSIKQYTPQMPPQAWIDQIVEAGTYAPTGMNHQSPLIVEVTNKDTRDQLSKLNAKILGVATDPFYGAPVILVVLADRQQPTHIYDGSLVMGNLMNAAHSLGLGSCWIHRAREVFDSPAGKALLKEWGIEGDYESIGHCIIGYRKGDEPTLRPRKAGYVRVIK